MLMAVSTKKISQCPTVKAVFSDMDIVAGRFDGADLIGGWGFKPNTAQAKKFAERHQIPYVYLEDAFIRSMRPGVLGEAPFGIVVDDAGMYYDASSVSQLDRLIQSADKKCDTTRAQHLIKAIKQHHISKYNDGILFNHIDHTDASVLIIDQTFGDMSISLGKADSSDFDRMLEDALKENEGAKVYLKIHPDVLLGKKKGCVDLDKVPNDVTIIHENYHPISLLSEMDKVYVVTSQMGFEACLLDKEVFCYGSPFYSGWGFVHERGTAPVPQHRGIKRSVEEVFWAAYVEYPTYVHPIKGEVCKIEDIIQHVLEQKKGMARNGLQKTWVIGFSLWKRVSMEPFFIGNSHQKLMHVPHFTKALKKGATTTDRIVFWGRKQVEQQQMAQKMGFDISIIEDGFLRSAGLGSDLTPPLSLIIDTRGVYFDSTVESDLEYILNTEDLSENILHMASTLKNKIVSLGISKYNVGSCFNFKATRSKDQKVILVPGQVPADASIQYGCIGEIRSNIDLLMRVREENPSAYVVYKIHPDIYSGNRKDSVSLAEIERYCDQVVVDVDIHDCILAADEVHVMTSLAGFEALLREKKVVCYGVPFYSGWGLTVDKVDIERRKRILTLDELVSGVLIQYPLYVHPKTNRYCSALDIIEYLSQQKKSAIGSHYYSRLWKKARILWGILLRRLNELFLR